MRSQTASVTTSRDCFIFTFLTLGLIRPSQSLNPCQPARKSSVLSFLYPLFMSPHVSCLIINPKQPTSSPRFHFHPTHFSKIPQHTLTHPKTITKSLNIYEQTTHSEIHASKLSQTFFFWAPIPPSQNPPRTPLLGRLHVTFEPWALGPHMGVKYSPQSSSSSAS